MLTGSSLLTRHLSQNIELEHLAISLEANGSERIITNHEDGINIVLAIGHTIARIRAFVSTNTTPMQHLRNFNEPEAVNGTNLTIQKIGSISIVLNRDESVKEPILKQIYADKDHPCWADTAWILDATGDQPAKN